MSDDTRSIESRPPAGPVLIGVTNAVLSNTGDAAIFEAITVSLRRAFGDTCQIVAFDSNASVTSRLYPEWEIHQQLSVSPPREPARLRNVLQRVRHRLVRLLTDDRRASRLLAAPLVRRSRFARAYRRFEELDVVVSSGGTYLVDHYNFEARVLELRLADVLGKRVILWTQSMGPFESSRAVSQIERIGAVTDAVFFRDDRSARAWSRRVRGSDAEAREVPDAVFALTAPTPTASTAAVEPARRALLSVREWSRGVDASSFDTAAYAASMRSAGALLSSSGWDVRALSTCQGVPSYAYDDSAEAARIFAGVDVDVDRETVTTRAYEGISTIDKAERLMETLKAPSVAEFDVDRFSTAFRGFADSYQAYAAVAPTNVEARLGWENVVTEACSERCRVPTVRCVDNRCTFPD